MRSLSAWRCPRSASVPRLRVTARCWWPRTSWVSSRSSSRVSSSAMPSSAAKSRTPRRATRPRSAPENSPGPTTSSARSNATPDADDMLKIDVVRSVAALRAVVRPHKHAGKRIGLVPTMGALHQGHLELVKTARRMSDFVIASIFVNPLQFNQSADLTAYPRDEATDLNLLAATGTDLVFAPSVAEMYPQGFGTQVRVSGLTDHLDGPARPGHFEGVATVVTKLFTQVEPDVACFGE